MEGVRPAHPEGPSYLAHTPNGRKLITAGSNPAIRVFETGSVNEPVTIDDCKESNTAIVATNDFFVTGSEDGSVCKFSLESNALDEVLIRCTLSIRDLALSPNGQWLAVASDELVVKVVNTSDMERVFYLREQQKAVKHVTFDLSGKIIAVSGSDGVIYFYSFDNGQNEEGPKFIRKMESLTRQSETDDPSCCRAAWHPDGRAFGVPTGTRDIQVVSHRDWERQRSFKSGHTGDVTGLAWSPNGALLVTTGKDHRICLWDTKTQRVIQRINDINGTVYALAWHPTQNILSYITDEGELHIHDSFVSLENLRILQKGDLHPAPFIHDPLQEISGNSRQRVEPRDKDNVEIRRPRRGSRESVDSFLDQQIGELGDGDGLDNFVEDDDEGGYAEINRNGKRSNGHLAADQHHQPQYKRQARGSWQPRIHQSFQPGSTPWRGERRYLCVNLVGSVWTVDHNEGMHHTVTVEFFDRSVHQPYHFTDPSFWDKACLTDKGALFACHSKDNEPAQIHYRPHQYWTSERPVWNTSLPEGEEVVSLALSDSYAIVTTSADYIRIYTPFGMPFRVTRTKSSPTVTCASWRDYIITVGNGTVGGSGMTNLRYTIENVRRNKTYQSEDAVAIPDGCQLQNVFFSDTGDPYIYDSTGVLLVCLHWREPGQAQWVPMLDTKQLARLASGRKEETYWPVGVARDTFYAIVLKGGYKHPDHPLPEFAEFSFEIPLESAAAKASRANSGIAPQNDPKSLEERFIRTSVTHALYRDLLDNVQAPPSQYANVQSLEGEIDRTLLKLLADECREGEDRGMKGLELVRLFLDKTGKTMNAARQVAERWGRQVLAEKIVKLAEQQERGIEENEGLERMEHD